MMSSDPSFDKFYPIPKDGCTVVVFPDGSHDERESQARVSDLLSERELQKISSREWKVEGVLRTTQQVSSVDPSRVIFKHNIPHVELSANAWLDQSGVIVISEAQHEV